MLQLYKLKFMIKQININYVQLYLRRVGHKLFHEFLTTLVLSWKSSPHRDLHKRSQEPQHRIQLEQPCQQYSFKVTGKRTRH